MTRRRRASDRHSQERWLLSYADFITLLFACFVVLFASSKFDETKSGSMASALKNAFHGSSLVPDAGTRIFRPQPDENATSKRESLENQFKSTLANELDSHVVTLKMESQEITLSLKEVGFFDSGSAAMREGSEASLARIASVLKNYSNAIRIEGHTDDLPIATEKFASNWELSSARAIEITRLLTGRFGIEPARLSIAGFAEYRPIRPNSDAAGRAANRRVDIVIVGPVIP